LASHLQWRKKTRGVWKWNAKEDIWTKRHELRHKMTVQEQEFKTPSTIRLVAIL
jgi:hypothetical protein